ncbi:MAG: imidazoleglycerol-phosphate dehydratase [Methanocellales archaeon]
MRIAKVEQNGVEVSLNLDGSGKAQVKTSKGFFDHILTSFAKHGAFDLSIKIIQMKGDLAEKIGMALGIALKKALGEEKSIKRYGFAAIPMDDSLAIAAVDISGRGYLKFSVEYSCREVAGFAVEEVEVFTRAFAHSAGITLHVKAEGVNNHHKIEAIFKALGIALSEAVKKSEQKGVPSTKGVL